ncbi:MAG: DNA methyltransferase [Fimbriimonadaceae bacterium]|nr:DNA methyltransferase [Fimbriimonadaceae bacterium]
MFLAAHDLDRPQWDISSPLHNKLAPEDRPVHAWYRFVLSYPPHLVRQYLTSFGVQPGDVMLDPFCGTGTTMVECKKNGIASVGFEANPMAALASRVKTDWSPSAIEFSRIAKWVAENARQEISERLQDLTGIADAGMVCEPEQLDLYGLRSLDNDAFALLLQNSISPRPLHRALVLKKWIGAAPRDLTEHLQLALAWTLVSRAGNVRFGPEVGTTRPKVDADVVTEWLAQCERMSIDLASYNDRRNIPSHLIQADSRNVSQLEDGSISAVFTSPPYPNEKDYTRTTRLESVVLGLIQNKKELRELKEGLLRSNTRNVYVADEDDKFVEGVPEIQAIATEIERRRIAMGKTSGFEKQYHRAAKLYFGGMAKHLENLKPKLRPGAMLGYVVGDQASYLQVHIPTGQLLGKIATARGYEVASIDLFRTRLATATKQQLREEVLVLRWPG